MRSVSENGACVGLALPVNSGEPVVFVASGDAILERSSNMKVWDVVASKSASIVHSGEGMAYRMRGTNGPRTLTVGV